MFLKIIAGLRNEIEEKYNVLPINIKHINLVIYSCVLGGDDIRQLCEAGEEEFLEIMALVGMAAKPLHVRRLQKALQEWITQPGTRTCYTCL